MDMHVSHRVLQQVQTGPILAATTARRKIWDLGATLHCSIIGTCIGTLELRNVLRKCDALANNKLTDHEVHNVAVLAAKRHDVIAKQIHKALDARHRIAINQAARAKSADELLDFWQQAAQRGEIPGAYWAVLTHRHLTQSIVERAFADVHMLSHLVGAANRADIRRLQQLDGEKAALEETLARQEKQLRDGFLARDAKIRDLNRALSSRIEVIAGHLNGEDTPAEVATLNRLVADLRKQINDQMRRLERAELRLFQEVQARAEDTRRLQSMERELAALDDEVKAAELKFAADIAEPQEPRPDPLNLAGAVILYVGGRPNNIPQLRSIVAKASGEFLHHDGGVEETRDLLPALVHRADAAFFPVDCISHDAALRVKRICRQAGKPFVALRSSGITSLLRALHATWRASTGDDGAQH